MNNEFKVRAIIFPDYPNCNHEFKLIKVNYETNSAIWECKYCNNRIIEQIKEVEC